MSNAESLGVIFDSDGVIVDSEPFSLAAFRQAMQEQGVFLNDEHIMANCGLTDADIVRYVSDKFGIEADLDLFHSRKQELYAEMVVSGNLKACEGAAELLSNLERGHIPFALASSGSMSKIRLNLTLVGLWGRFPIIISGENMERSKPHPDIFLEAAKRLNLKPERCVVIEDSLNGIEAAHRAGMACVAVIGTFPKEKLSRADFVIDSLSRLTVEKLNSFVLEKNFSKGGNSC
ncbi:HAD family phosphatase [Candidatus Sumerlaeota bacterium]|nr:HAD family phosphatase [Candidatus Sumerlaeota bacterium]